MVTVASSFIDVVRWRVKVLWAGLGKREREVMGTTGYNWNNFMRFLNRAFPKFAQDGSQELQLPFKEDE